MLQVEHKWLQLLYSYIKGLFSNKWLPSHDHTHHLRVWYYAKRLVELLDGQGYVFTEQMLEQLIIAVFFHDTGLTRTLDASHGKESRLICHDFLTRYASFSKGDYDEILEAIEKHDDKTYAYNLSTGKDMPDDMNTLLTVCDDLDAFGAIGVFRYLEIYVQREIPIHSIPEKVIENLTLRFDNLKNHYGRLDSFMKEQEKRYQFTMDFYCELEKQLRSYADLSSDSGPVAVVNILLQEVLEKRTHFTKLPVYAEKLASDAFGTEYFQSLYQELSLYPSTIKGS
ncbi:MAG: HD domain-containing protein [Bacteroidales bacterium]|nr:HD domain-containing protein [Bacteroidales bacterium]